ncbi:uncharacterized protein IL334_006622 [Kwoniella shivajii]|uniref:Ubiquitin carboxyl-terminal hydrolase n=1 Tax=Kwoniella shivajii TaxID=564305 RepID=A0ABZ1D6T6_9TREE|nr:hypothetical protein IL334_006622 [Kwoniella shivajii]
MSRLLRGFGTPKQGNNKDSSSNGTRSSNNNNNNNQTSNEPVEIADLAINTKFIARAGLNNKDKDAVGEKELLFGLENFGNTCYCNSVIQALYSCEAFRQFVESYPDAKPPLTAIAPSPDKDGKSMVPILNGFGGGGPLSPQISKGNPFESPSFSTNQTSGGLGTPGSPMTPGAGGKEKRSWTSLGRRPTNQGSGVGGNSLPTLSALQISQQQNQNQNQPTSPTLEDPKSNWKTPEPNPNQSPPSVFQTIQTLFNHLTNAPPHQPLPKKETKNGDGEAQTASLLPGAPVPTEAAPGSPTPSLTTSSNPNAPQGPPLLASLPPPSAARGGGPWQAGKLGRGVVTPEDLLRTVKRENEMFRGMIQQDAHEFLGWLLNQVAEEIELVDRHLKTSGQQANHGKGPGKTFVQSLFEGILTNETRCLSCETTSSRDELFLDLSIDIEQHTSVTHCLRQFSASEMLCQKNKFYCDSCCGLQEAEKRMKIKKLPNILALHLKRFKYQETTGRYAKLFYRVPFPTQLRLPNTTEDMENPDRLYELFSVVVHIGNGPHHGHYVTLVRSKGRWIMCDDENVEPIDDDDLFRYFGDYPSGAGYVLFYQAVDMDLASLGLKAPTPLEPEQQPEVSISSTISKQPKAELKDLKEHQLIDFSDETTPPIKQEQEPAVSVSVPAPSSVPVEVETPTKKRQPPPAPPSRRTSTSASLTTTTPTSTRTRQNSFPIPPTTRTDSTPISTPNVKPNGVTDRQLGFDTSSPVKTPPVPPPSRRALSSFRNPDSPTPTQSQTQTQIQTQGNPSSRPSTSGSTTFGGLGVNVPNSMHGTNSETVQGIPNGNGSGSSPNTTNTTMSSSVISTSTNSDATSSLPNSTTLAKPIPTSVTSGQTSGSTTLSPTQQPTGSVPNTSMSSSVSSSNLGIGLGRKPSTSQGNRDRTISGSSTTSGSGNNYAGGGSLSRRLSGMSGKLGRSGSMAFGKFGIGKKDKNDKIGEEEGNSSKKGLLS